jgi:dihydrofolate synthase/folylpolyglutamate synthase
VHVYTSPNLVRLNERFRSGARRRPSGRRRRTRRDALSECEAKNGGAPITVFEIETAAAFLLFARHPADVCCSKSGSAAGSTPPMWSSTRWPA